MNAEKHLDKAVAVIPGIGDHSLEISVEGYQFPTAEDMYDLNWLNLSFRLKGDGQERTFTDSCILTWELEQFAEGLQEFLDSPEEKTYEPYFTEGTLWFEFKRDENGNIKLETDLYAGGMLPGTGILDHFHMCGIMSERNLRRAVKAMRIAGAAFPERESKEFN